MRNYLRKFVLLGVLLTSCSLSSPLVAAGPIMHAYLGLKWLEYFAPEYDEAAKQKFILGTLFPDIRYIGNISRNQTHPKRVSLTSILKTKSPFEQGMQFHSYVDNVRFHFLKHHKINEQLNKLPNNHKSIFIKLAEDQMLFDKNSWFTIKKYLVSPCEEEENFELSSATVTKWHLGLTFYFSALPSTLLSQISLFDKGILMLDAKTVSDWSQRLKIYEKDKTFNQYVNDLMQHFDKQLLVEKPSLTS